MGDCHSVPTPNFALHPCGPFAETRWHCGHPLQFPIEGFLGNDQPNGTCVNRLGQVGAFIRQVPRNIFSAGPLQVKLRFKFPGLPNDGLLPLGLEGNPYRVRKKVTKKEPSAGRAATWRGQCTQVFPHILILLLSAELATPPNSGVHIFKFYQRPPIPMFAEELLA